MSSQINNKVLSEKTVSSVVEDEVLKCKINLTNEYPFLGYFAATTKIVYCDDLPTAAATTIPVGTVYINPKFWMDGLSSTEERIFVLAHELLHIFLDHIGRAFKCSYNPKLWNYATDYVINLVLYNLNNRSVKMPEKFKTFDKNGNVIKDENGKDFSKGLFDTKYEKMSADEVYHKLLEEINNQSKGGGDDEDDIDDILNRITNGQSPLDEIDNREVSGEIDARNKQEIAASMNSDSKNYCDSGTLDLIRHLKELIEGKIRWEDILKQNLKSTNNEFLNYNTYNRRNPKGVLLPVNEGNSIDVILGIDTSGSMGQADMNQVLSEVSGVLNTFSTWNVDIVTCDTSIFHIGNFSSDEHTPEDVLNANYRGGGGTDMYPVIQYANEKESNSIKKTCILFTDGHLDDNFSYNIEDNVELIVIITSTGNKQFELKNSDILKIVIE